MPNTQSMVKMTKKQFTFSFNVRDTAIKDGRSRGSDSDISNIKGAEIDGYRLRALGNWVIPLGGPVSRLARQS